MLEVIKVFSLYILGIIIIGIISSFPIMILWNWIIVELFNGSVGLLTWDRAWGLSILCGLLFKSK